VVVHRGALRYTPAGLPALDIELLHESEVVHEGQPRKVSMSLKALAIGSLVGPVSAMALGHPATFGGYLANARNGRGLLFHLTALQG